MSARLDDPDLLARLIAFDTTSAKSNLACVDFIASYLDGPGVRLTRFPSPDGTKANLLAETGPEVGPDRAGLLLSGHLDVVPATEPNWTSDPFTLTRDGDRFVARGACDMKGFDALAINAVRDAAAAGVAQPLALLLSYDEEVGSLGIADLAAQWPAERRLPRATLIGEPTSLRVVRRHKGHLKVRVMTHGRSAHSGSPHLGDNAIERMTPILTDLDALRQSWRDEHLASSASFPEVPYVALIPARLRAGTALNVIPDACTLDLGIRLLPGTDAETYLQRVRDVVGDRATVTSLGQNPPLDTALDAPLVETLMRVMGQTDTIGVDFSSDGGWLATHFDCAPVVWGPGDITVAHRPDEFMPIAEWTRGGTLLRQVIAACTETEGLSS